MSTNNPYADLLRKRLLSTTLPHWCVRAILAEAWDHGHSAGQSEVDNLACSMLSEFETYLSRSKDPTTPIGFVTVEIWREGYAATCNLSGAKLLGTLRVEWGTTFERALHTFFAQNPDPHWEPATLTVRGCRLFPTRAEAIASFG